MSIAEVFLILFYTVLFSFIILRWKFFQHFGISQKWIVAIFIIKIIAGIFYGFVFMNLYGGGDTLDFFRDSEIVLSALKKDPCIYLRLVFGNTPVKSAPDLVPYTDQMMFYSTTGSYFIVRFHALVRLVSFGYYNVHVVFYNFITLIGILYLFRFFAGILREKKFLLAIAIFLFPSVVFWSSGMHKDGITLSAYGLILFFTWRMISYPSSNSTKQEERGVDSSRHFSFSGRRINHMWLNYLNDVIFILIGLWWLLLRHGFWLMLFIPGWIAFVFTQKFPKHIFTKYLLVYIFCFGISVNLNFIYPKFDFLNVLVHMQDDFSHLKEGAINLNLQPLYPTPSSFITAIPGALENGLLRPFFTEIHSFLQLGSAIENMVVLLFLIFCLIWRKKKLSSAEQSLFWFCLLFSLSIFIVTGSTIPVVGALVRYKMPGELFLLIAGIVLIRKELLPPLKV